LLPFVVFPYLSLNNKQHETSMGLVFIIVFVFLVPFYVARCLFGEFEWIVSFLNSTYFLWNCSISSKKRLACLQFLHCNLSCLRF
jgi:hypothetical protein